MDRCRHSTESASHASLAMILLASSLVACGGQTVRMSDRFWLRAPGAALIRLTPPPAAGAPGVLQTHQVGGTVTRHVASGRAGVDYRVTMTTDEGKPVELAYRLGGKRRLPLEVGDTARVRLLLRGHVSDSGHDRGLLVYRIEAEPQTTARDEVLQTAPTGPADAKGDAETVRLVRREVLIAAVDHNRLLPEDGLPGALRALRPTDVAAYQESGNFIGDCHHIREQRYFRLARLDLLVGSDAKVLNKKLYAPGSRLQLRDTATEDFDVVLLSNLGVTRSSCRDNPDPSWSWAAIRVQRPVEAGDP